MLKTIPILHLHCIIMVHTIIMDTGDSMVVRITKLFK